jgi:uncharacterized protein YecE (DUF72 family)
MVRDSKDQKGHLKKWKKWLSANTNEAYIFFNNREQKRLAFENALAFRDL